ncbi:B3 domain-containing protein At2g36080 [Gossypium raimondii]|uniref:TF-B3 domain-containing protein n=2 Tax=Gossypium raimondii TaxID=29730 RepID=A0A0D2QI58_GOSRA|nr:B3 domain-containing protein At2g36080 [Gossypium raimondii]KJB16586.1 hypothetical protein B456_002G237900 [Gossypium raimondii]
MEPTQSYQPSMSFFSNIPSSHIEDEYEQFDDHEKEPMFEKPLTPSDVGKLNRLVIPKQHAEKHFPLGGSGGDSVVDNKGLLLSFEDESGKCWRFRYSYWNSSQSYVLTKGWSRYVKEKQLDAGDIILFKRHRLNAERLFIGWRRRGAALDGGNAELGNNSGGVRGGDNGGWSSSRGLYQGNPYPGHIQGQCHGANVPYQHDCLHAGSMAENQGPGGNPKRLLRLFGVNLECHLDDSSEPSTPDSSSVSSQGPTSTHHFYSQSYTSNYMDIGFSRDMNQMNNHRA